MKCQLSTILCFRLLASSLTVCCGPSHVEATYPHAVSLSVRRHDDSEFYEARRLITAEEKSLPCHVDKLASWVTQCIGGSELMMHISPSHHMRFASDKEASAYKLFRKYGVGDCVTSNMFASEAFKRWHEYLIEAFPEDPDLRVRIMVATMVRYDEDKLIDSIAEAKSVPETSAIARKMEAALIDWWLSKFGKLVDALMDPVLQKWYTTLQKGDYAKDDLFLRAYARENFEEEEADLIAASETAGGLVSEMAMSILGIRRADEEFEKLGLDKATNIKAIMKHKNLTVWLAKVKKLGWNPVKLLLPKLKAVSSDKEILVECFSANRLPNELRGKLQDAVFDQWAGKSGSVVLKDLGLDKAGDELFSQELILSWADYMWRLYPKTAPTEMARVLWGQYKHKLIALVARAEESDNELVGALARDIAAAVNHYASEILPGPEVPPPVAPLPDI